MYNMHLVNETLTCRGGMLCGPYGVVISGQETGNSRDAPGIFYSMLWFS